LGTIRGQLLSVPCSSKLCLPTPSNFKYNLLICHCRGHGFESRRPRHSFLRLRLRAKFWRRCKKVRVPKPSPSPLSQIPVNSRRGANYSLPLDTAPYRPFSEQRNCQTAGPSLRLTIARLPRCIVILLRHGLAQENSSRISRKEGCASRLVNCFAGATLAVARNLGVTSGLLVICPRSRMKNDQTLELRFQRFLDAEEFVLRRESEQGKAHSQWAWAEQ